jgi:hypothetical protein
VCIVAVTPYKFVVGRDPLSKSTVRVKKSTSLIVLARAACSPPLSPWYLGASAITSTEGVKKSRSLIVLARAGCSPPLSPGGNLGVSTINLSAVRHSVSRKRPPPNLYQS